MNNRMRNTLSVLLMTILLLASAAKAQTPAGKAKANPPAPQSGNSAVTGSGTPGRLSKWTGVAGSSTYVLGDSMIFEDKFGNVGIGTTTPTSKLTVQGMIETTLGGLKFPDGTVQTTAAASGMQSIFHDATLAGNGTQASPLRIALPLALTGQLFVSNTAAPELGNAIFGRGSDTAFNNAGDGVRGKGGDSTALNVTKGGDGVSGVGGEAPNGSGGNGVTGTGGLGDIPGRGVFARGGSNISGSGFGGTGIEAQGGSGQGAGKRGGNGITASAGDGINGAVKGFAGQFFGDVEVQGNFNVTGGGAKNFKIDHPLDPENKVLYHAAIESSEVLNVYSGNAKTDEDGEATVTLPDWFEAINKDFRYQLTVVGQFAQAIVGDKIKSNRFQIRTNAPNVEVSWQVTGIRNDAAIRNRPFKLEEDKLQSERGYYLAPEAYGQPEERGVEWARDPQRMQQVKQQRMEAEQRRKQQ